MFVVVSESHFLRSGWSIHRSGHCVPSNCVRGIVAAVGHVDRKCQRHQQTHITTDTDTTTHNSTHRPGRCCTGSPSGQAVSDAYTPTLTYTQLYTYTKNKQVQRTPTHNTHTNTYAHSRFLHTRRTFDSRGLRPSRRPQFESQG